MYYIIYNNMSSLNKDDINYIVQLYIDNDYDDEKIKLLDLNNNPIYINIMNQLKEFYYN